MQLMMEKPISFHFFGYYMLNIQRIAIGEYVFVSQIAVVVEKKVIAFLLSILISCIDIRQSYINSAQ